MSKAALLDFIVVVGEEFLYFQVTILLLGVISLNFPDLNFEGVDFQLSMTLIKTNN